MNDGAKVMVIDASCLRRAYAPREAEHLIAAILDSPHRSEILEELRVDLHRPDFTDQDVIDETVAMLVDGRLCVAEFQDPSSSP